MYKRKELPTRMYRREIRYFKDPRFNSTTQWFNRPEWWPGTSEKTNEHKHTRFIEGQIIWEDEDVQS